MLYKSVLIAKKNNKKQNEQTVVSASCEVEGKVIKERCESVFSVSRLWLHTYVQDVQRKPHRLDSEECHFLKETSNMAVSHFSCSCGKKKNQQPERTVLNVLMYFL